MVNTKTKPEKVTKKNPEQKGGFALPKTPDKKVETETTEAIVENLTQEVATETTTLDPAPAPTTTTTQTQETSTQQIQIPKDELTKEIEKILEDDLEEVYFTMSPEQQTEFKLEGEKATSTIRQILKSGVVKIKKVLSIISNWLKMIPGVNKFFLEKKVFTINTNHSS